MSLGELSKMSRKTVSADLSFEEIWEQMDAIEPLTPSLEEYKCGKKSDDYMFEDADARFLYEG